MFFLTAYGAAEASRRHLRPVAGSEMMRIKTDTRFLVYGHRNTKDAIVAIGERAASRLGAPDGSDVELPPEPDAHYAIAVVRRAKAGKRPYVLMTQTHRNGEIFELKELDAMRIVGFATTAEGARWIIDTSKAAILRQFIAKSQELGFDPPLTPATLHPTLRRLLLAAK